MLKIALFTDADVFAGTERHILDLALALRDEGCAVEIACPGGGVLAHRARAAQVAVLPVEKGAALIGWRCGRCARVCWPEESTLSTRIMAAPRSLRPWPLRWPDVAAR